MELQIENLPKPLRKRGLSRKIAQICEENDIVFMAVFGSFVRGEQKKTSDVDVAMEFDRSKPKSLFDLVHVENDLSKVLGRKVDLGIFSSLNPLIVEDVRMEMRVIYEKGQSVS